MGRFSTVPRPKPAKIPSQCAKALATTLNDLRQQTEYSRDEDFVFASPTLDGKRPLWGQRGQPLESLDQIDDAPHFFGADFGRSAP